MKRILFCCVLALLVSVSCVRCAVRPIAQRIADMKRDLNQEFGFPEDRNMFVVTVTRTPTTSSGAVPLISHHEFEQVMRLLYASAVGSDEGFTYSAGDPRVELNQQMDKYLSTEGRAPRQEIEGIDSTVQNISWYFANNSMANASKLVVFNEMFFSQMQPLSLEQKGFIEERLFDVSKASPTTVFYPNFLYKETRTVPGTTVYEDLYRMAENTRNGIRAVGQIVPISRGLTPASTLSMVFAGGSSVLGECARAIAAKVSEDTRLVDWPYLVNETRAICDAMVLTRYRKVGYFTESDTDVKKGVLYSSGVGYDEGVDSKRPTLRDRLLHNVSIDVCLDLNIGVRSRSKCHWQNSVDGPDSSLHLVQSNSIDPFCDPVNRGNLPKDTGIVHADKYPHPSWIPPAVDRPQSVYLPYIDATGNLRDFGSCKAVFCVRFLGSDYAFSFLKL